MSKSLSRRLGTAVAATIILGVQRAEGDRKVNNNWLSADWERLLTDFEALDDRRKIIAFDQMMYDLRDGRSQVRPKQSSGQETLELLVQEVAQHLRKSGPDITAAIDCRLFSWKDCGYTLHFEFWEYFTEWAKFRVGIRKYGPGE